MSTPTPDPAAQGPEPAGREPEPAVQAAGDPRPRGGGAGRATLLGLLVPGLAFLTSLPTWIHAEAASVLQEQRIDVTGTQAAPAVTALSLAALAAVLALRISGRVLRMIISVVIAAAGLGTGAAVVTVLTDPALAARTQVSEATNVTGADGSYVLTVWPWLCLVLAAATVVTAVWLLLTSRHWRTNSRRFERSPQRAGAPGASGHADDIDAWDSLSEGRDPTD